MLRARNPGASHAPFAPCEAASCAPAKVLQVLHDVPTAMAIVESQMQLGLEGRGGL